MSLAARDIVGLLKHDLCCPILYEVGRSGLADWCVDGEEISLFQWRTIPANPASVGCQKVTLFPRVGRFIFVCNS